MDQIIKDPWYHRFLGKVLQTFYNLDQNRFLSTSNHQSLRLRSPRTSAGRWWEEIQTFLTKWRKESLWGNF